LLYAQLLRVTGRELEAHKLLLHSYRVFVGTNNEVVAWRVPKELMQVFGSGKLSNPTVAIFYGKQAVNDLQKMRGNLVEFEQRNSGVLRERDGSELGVSNFGRFAGVAGPAVRSAGSTGHAQGAGAVRLHRAQIRTRRKDRKSREAGDGGDLEFFREATGRHHQQGSQPRAGIRGALGEVRQAAQLEFAADQARFDALTKQLDAAQKTFDTQAESIASASKDPEMQKRLLHEIDDNSRAFHGTLKSLGHNAVVLQYYIMDDNVKILLTTPDIAVARETTIKRADLNAQI
jgi:hypothetical protein